MSRFKTEGEIVNFMLDYTGLLSTEYKVHHMGSMLPEGMYVTLKNPLNKWCPIYKVFETMVKHGYNVEYNDQYGPTCIIL